MKRTIVSICDDDSRVVQNLRKVIEGFFEKYDALEASVKTFGSPQELMGDLDFDVLFLDLVFEKDGVQFSDTGINVLEKLRQQGIEAPIIFISSMRSFTASRAGIVHNVLDYIVKPIRPKEVNDALARALRQIGATTEPKHRLVLKTQEQTHMLYAEDIYYITITARKRYIYLQNKEIVTTGSLKDIYDGLPQDQFAYAHKAFIVNLDMVDITQGTEIVLINGDKVPMSRNNKQEFIKALHTFAKRG